MTTEVPKIEIQNSNPSNVMIILLAMVIIAGLVFFGQKVFINTTSKPQVVSKTVYTETEKSPVDSETSSTQTDVTKTVSETDVTNE